MEEYEEIVSDIIKSRGYKHIGDFIHSTQVINYNWQGLYPIQEELIKFYNDNWEDDSMVILNSRQSGTSTLTMGFFLYKCVGNNNMYNFHLFDESRVNSITKLNILRQMCDSRNIKYNNIDDAIIINGNRISVLTPGRHIIKNENRDIIFCDDYTHVTPMSMDGFDISKKGLNNKLVIYNSSPSPSSSTNNFRYLYENCPNTMSINWKDVPARDSTWYENMRYVIDGVFNFDVEYNNKFP